MLTTVGYATEADYVNADCRGTIEYVLPDKTRVDCIVGDYAIEYDFAHKWYEGIGQALHYSVMTGKRPGLVLIVEKPDQCKYVERAKVVNHEYWLGIEIRALGVACQ